MSWIAIKTRGRNWLLLGLFLCCFNLYSQKKTSTLEVVISIEETKALSIKQIFKYIESQRIKLAYSSNEIDLEKTIVLKNSKYTVKELLALSIKNTPLKIVTRKGKILLVAKKDNPSNYVILSGFVKEASTKEALIGCAVYEPNLNKGTVTNNYGFYSLKLKRGNHSLVSSYIGFQSQELIIEAEKDTIFHTFYLPISKNNLDEVIVKGKIPSYMYPTKSHESILKDEIDDSTNLYGENDFMNTLQSKVGVNGNSGGMGNLSVRGGGTDHNLVLIDGIPVYNYNHIGGVFSIFNSQVIRKVDFYRGAFPARYNGRLSSVIDIRTKDGDKHEFHGEVAWSPIAISSSLEGPIIKEKSSFTGSFRRSFLDFLVKEIDLNLYDFNFKADYIIDDLNNIYLSFYSGRDHIKINPNLMSLYNDLSLDWGNLLVSVKWNHIHTPNLFQYTSLTYSEFNNEISRLTKNSNVNRFKDVSQISDVSFKTDFEYYLSEKMQTNFGIELKQVAFKSPLRTTLLTNKEESLTNNSIHTLGYIENVIKLNKKLRLDLGLNISAYIVKDKNFYDILPRAVVTYSPSNKNEWFASFSMLSQFHHEITIGTISLPSELKTPSTKDIAPEKSSIIEFGYQHRFNRNNFLNIQAYYKNLYGIIRYRTGQNVFEGLLAPQLNNRILFGERERKGVEVQLIKKIGKLKSEISYALSKTEDRFDKINNGLPFPSRLDIRNNLTISLKIPVNDKLKIAALWNYSSGQRISIPQQTFTGVNNALGINTPYSLPYSYQITAPNQYKLLDNYHLNIGCVYTKKTKKLNYWRFGFGINNIVGNTAPFIIKSSINSQTNKLEVSEIKALNFLPYISINYKF